MPKITIALGVLLILVAIAGFIATGSSHPTALIPGGIGILFCIFGAVASSPDLKRRKLWMHIAVTVALLLFLGTIKSDINVMQLAKGATFPHPIAIEEKAGMSLLCLLYVLLAIRWFIGNRRNRVVA